MSAILVSEDLAAAPVWLPPCHCLNQPSALTIIPYSAAANILLEKGAAYVHAARMSLAASATNCVISLLKCYKAAAPLPSSI